MKALVIASLLALAAPQAAAGDTGFRFGIDVQHKGVRVKVGVGKHAPKAPSYGKHVRKPSYGKHVRKPSYGKHARRPWYGHRHRYRRVWVPGHYEIVHRKVWVPGYTHKVWRPAKYGYRRDRCGFRVRYLVRPAYWQTVYVPGHWDHQTQKVWRPGHYRVSHRARHRRGHRI
jgi:hypothetical protein